jgi:hypothetical protein
MRKLTVEELKKIMRQCAGDDGGSALDGGITGIGFDGGCIPRLRHEAL